MIGIKRRDGKGEKRRRIIKEVIGEREDKEVTE